MDLDHTDSLDAILRRRARERRLGENARCHHCGCRDLPALSLQPTCYECLARAQGRPQIERHHPIGRAVDDDTVAVPGNAHRLLDDQRRDWPAELRGATEGDPLLGLAAVLLAIADFSRWLLGRLDDWADWLLRLRESLLAHLGSDWWKTIGGETP